MSKVINILENLYQSSSVYNWGHFSSGRHSDSYRKCEQHNMRYIVRAWLHHEVVEELAKRFGALMLLACWMWRTIAGLLGEPASNPCLPLESLSDSFTSSVRWLGQAVVLQCLYRPFKCKYFTPSIIRCSVELLCSISDMLSRKCDAEPLFSVNIPANNGFFCYDKHMVTLTTRQYHTFQPR